MKILPLSSNFAYLKLISSPLLQRCVTVIGVQFFVIGLSNCQLTLWNVQGFFHVLSKNSKFWGAEIIFLWDCQPNASSTSNPRYLQLVTPVSHHLSAFNYSFKIFLRFWLAKSTRIIHHNQLLLTKFGRILRLINRWRQKCSTVAG